MQQASPGSPIGQLVLMPLENFCESARKVFFHAASSSKYSQGMEIVETVEATNDSTNDALNARPIARKRV